MALGTITRPTSLGSRADWTEGNRRYRIRDVQLTSGANYTTGGETIAAGATGVGVGKVIEFAIPMGLALTASGTTSRAVAYISQTDGSVKQLVHTTASVEATAATDQSTFTQRTLFIGR